MNHELGIKEKFKYKLYPKRYFLYASRGFTLIELLIVLAVLSILAVVLMTLINPVAQFQKARDAQRKSDLAQIQKTLEAYFDDNGQYPAHSKTPDAVWFRIKPPTGYIEWGSTWTAYNTMLPKDPTSSSRNYVYYAGPNGQSYWLYASLERTSDLQVCNGGAACTNAAVNGLSVACGSSVWPCNYGATSPNTSP